MKKKLTTIRTLTARLAMTLVLAMLTAATAWAQTVTVVPEDGGTYWVENGTKLYVTPATNFYLVSVTKDGVQQPLEAIAPVGEEPYYTISASDIITITFREYTNNVRVTFDLNGHSGTTPTERDYLLGQVVAQPTGIEADGNLTVCGWSTNKKGTKPYDFSTPLDNTLSYDRTNERFTLKLYAIWADASQDCTVTFNANGGTGTMDAVTQKGGSLYTIPLNGFTYDGHYLRGWATSASGSVAYTPGQTIFLTDDLPLYAVWTTDISYVPDASYNLSPTAYTLAGAGYTDITCTLTSLVLGKVWNTESNQYEQARYINFWMNGGTLSDGNGHSIAFNVDDPFHNALGDRVYQGNGHNSQGKQFVMAVYIDPANFAAATPGTYTGTFTYDTYWDEDIKKPGASGSIALTLVVPSTPAPTAYAITTDGNCEVYNADYWSENIPLTEAPEGMELVIRLKDEAQPESGKYFTEEFSVNGVSLGRESEWVFKSDFTMPAEAVTVAALQADKMVLTFDFTTGGAQKMDNTAVRLFNNDESVSGRYDADDYTLFDLNGGGIYDMKMYWGTDGNCYVEPLSNADATGSYSFNYDEPTKCYGTITFVFPEAPTAVDVTLADAADNASTLSSHNGELANVTLSGRTFDKSGSWNTLCLPFDVTTLTGTPLEGATIKELDTGETALNTTTGKLTLKFTAVSSIEAGRPYIVKWSGSGSLSNPVFEGVTISSTTPTEAVSSDGNVKFVGQYAPFAIDADNLNAILFVGGGNQIGYSKNARSLNCFRAHFWVKPNDGAEARRIEVDFGDGEATSIRLVDADGTSAATGIYTLDGRRLQTEPTQRGVYIRNGKKMVK